jgi:3-isopropylmalate dehydratase
MPIAEGAPQTLYDKILAAHVVDEKLDGTVLLYIGMLHTLLHETTTSSTRC